MERYYDNDDDDGGGDDDDDTDVVFQQKLENTFIRYKVRPIMGCDD